MPLTWTWYRWAELSPDVLYAFLQLRSSIFVVEQKCLFSDMDGRDPFCDHLCGWNEQRILTAYLRLLPPGARIPDVSLGRIVVTQPARRRGVGRLIMNEGLRRCETLHPGKPVKVSAQQHLEPFYQSLGFRSVGAPYPEDGIWHIDMVRPG